VKKLFGIALVLAVVTTLVFGSVALADDPTDVHVDWDGSGVVFADVYAGNDADIHFLTVGNGIKGYFDSRDYNDNPYTYNVDTTASYINAEVGGTGFIDFWSNRTDSHVGTYGPAGDASFNHLLVEDGWGAMAMANWTNYASLKDCCYGKPRTVGSHHFEADAVYYEMGKQVDANDGDFAYVRAWGSGTAELDCMNSETWNGSMKLGRGCGCYTDADFNAVGSGTFDVYAEGNNGAAFYAFPLSSSGDGTPGSASVQIIANFATSFSIADYSVHGW
jgi:hypothetical protein